ncbi:hypothetical protein NDU88_003233 [Pleurodeles waltl]|uniref:Uncharacterized protein n=1 Tax=Pleurodeles waltl TaxID=8319 RepID=A0AAV7UXW3_PLEWA|nr:hypothetical protein NDU88_003233 [Pleurodeles waltl]
MLLALPSRNEEHGSKNAQSNGDTSTMKIPESTVMTTGLYHRSVNMDESTEYTNIPLVVPASLTGEEYLPCAA